MLSANAGRLLLVIPEPFSTHPTFNLGDLNGERLRVEEARELGELLGYGAEALWRRLKIWPSSHSLRR